MVSYVEYKGYKVFSNGKVLGKNGYLKPLLNSSGYHKITLYVNKKPNQYYLHRLIAKLFIPNKENKREVNHKDFNKLNNSYDNLEWVSSKENTEHYYRNKIFKKVGKFDKFSNKLLQEFKNLESVKSSGFSPSSVCKCIKGIYKTSGGFKWSYL